MRRLSNWVYFPGWFVVSNLLFTCWRALYRCFQLMTRCWKRRKRHRFHSLSRYEFTSSYKTSSAQMERKSAHSGGGVAASFARFDGWRWIGGCRMLERGEGRPTSLRPADWVTELRAPGSVCDQQRKVLENDGNHRASSSPPATFLNWSRGTARSSGAPGPSRLGAASLMLSSAC